MINFLLSIGIFGPAVTFALDVLRLGVAVAVSVVGILCVASISSFLWVRSAGGQDMFGCPIAQFEGTATDQLAKAELGLIYFFRNKHAWTVDAADWLQATSNFGFTVRAAFLASNKFSYLKIGLLCLPAQYLGFAADFGPGAKLLFAAATKNLYFAQVFVIIVSSWAACFFLYLGFDRLFANFNGSLSE